MCVHLEFICLSIIVVELAHQYDVTMASHLLINLNLLCGYREVQNIQGGGRGIRDLSLS